MVCVTPGCIYSTKADMVSLKTKKKSNLRPEGIDSLTDGGKYFNSDLLLVLLTPMRPARILLIHILADHLAKSRGIN